MRMFFLSIRRRKKEIRYVSLVTFIATFLMTGILLLQDILNQFVMERNYHNYGEWVLSSKENRLEHPYFDREGCCTVTVCVLNAKQENSGSYIGAIDENMVEIGHIKLYEGQLPQKDDEVAMSPQALTELGYDYELGQKIILRYIELDSEGRRVLDKDKNPVVTEHTYRLTGVICGFASVWKTSGSDPLPDILVTQQEAAQYPKVTHTWYYRLDRAWEDIDILEFTAPFREMGRRVVYNSYVYGQQIWGSSEVFRNVSLVMLAVSVLAIGYLLASYTSKRRESYYRYRCMGADRWQVREMILTECLYAVLPFALSGAAGAYAVGLVCCKVLSVQQQWGNFYSVNVRILLSQLAAVAAILFCSVMWNVFSIRDKNLVSNSRSVELKKLPALRRRAARIKYPERDFLKRYDKLHFTSVMQSVLFSMCCCSLLVLCADKLYYDLETNGEMYELSLQFSMTKRVNCVYEDGLYSSEVCVLSEGLGEEELEELRRIEGIEGVSSTVQDGIHYLDWEGKEESPVLLWMQARNDARLSGAQGMEFCFYDTDEIARQLMICDSQVEVNWDAWKDGEEILLVSDPQVWDTQGTRQELIEDTIHAGDMAKIVNSMEPEQESMPVRLAGIIYLSLDNWNEVMRSFSGKEYTILASKKLAEKIAQWEETDLKENTITGKFNLIASYEATDKQLAAFANRYGFQYYTQGEEWRNIYAQRMLQTLSVYGTLFLLILGIYLILQKNFTNSKIAYRSKQYVLLKKIGMDHDDYLRLEWRDAVRGYLWLFAGIPVGVLLRGYLVCQSYAQELAGSSGSMISCRLLSFSLTDDPLWLALDYIVFDMNYPMVITVVGLLFVIMVIWRMYLTESYIKRIE